MTAVVIAINVVNSFSVHTTQHNTHIFSSHTNSNYMQLSIQKSSSKLEKRSTNNLPALTLFVCVRVCV